VIRRNGGEIMNFDLKSQVRTFTDMMSEGFIVIDNEGIIQIYNDKAKEIFGLKYSGRFSHEGGRIEKGDLVIIADNKIGKDDGNLDEKKLKDLGLRGQTVEKGDALIIVGEFENPSIDPQFRIIKDGSSVDTLELKTRFRERDIEASIDFLKNIIEITVDGISYPMEYINAIGHIVVIDGEDGTLKFCQDNGYTAREESASDILSKKQFLGKGENTKELDVIGKHIFHIHHSELIIKQFHELAKGENIVCKDKYEEINGFPTLCTLFDIEEEGNRIGAALKVEDITEIRKAHQERDRVLIELEKASEKLHDEEAVNREFPAFVGDSQEMAHVKRMALKASKTTSSVLILGESGTGKTFLAKSIHNKSRFSDKPFVHVNCGAIPENLLESELFGYEKGAFTGANAEGKRGLFETANGGTIFLDEIGDMPLGLQVKLLQVIQEKYFYRVGDRNRIDLDIRIMAATNKNLEEEMQKGRFRQDLYYRINVFPIWIPPLRDRKEDLHQLMELLLPKICRETGSHEKRMTSEAMNMLLRYSWPGNIRELENILERAVNLSDGNNILSKHIVLTSGKEPLEDAGQLSLKEQLERVEKELIEKTLKESGGDKKMVMAALGLGKTALYDKLKKYGIS
jgi:transcriptional regulator with PAS, ATPase and Fis domain